MLIHCYECSKDVIMDPEMSRFVACLDESALSYVGVVCLQCGKETHEYCPSGQVIGACSQTQTWWAQDTPMENLDKERLQYKLWVGRQSVAARAFYESRCIYSGGYDSELAIDNFRREMDKAGPDIIRYFA